MTATTLQKLIKYPHGAVFDRSPDGELALRIRHPDGASWRVADEVLTVGAGAIERSYDLSAHTIGSLAAALENDGFEVAYLSPEFSLTGASALVEGAGSQTGSNGDHVHAYRSLLWAIFGGYARELRAARYQSDQALRQMVIWQAEGEWLDLWGKLYADERRPGEQDSEYAPRIPVEAFRLRVNGLAIEHAIKDRTGDVVEIREPWRQMFRSSLSRLSGTDRFPDSRYYSYFVVHPVSRQPIDWQIPLEVIHRNRAAGIEVYPPSVEFAVRHVIVQPPAEYLVHAGGGELRAMSTPATSEVPLGIMRLDDNEITLNHRAMIYELRTFANAGGLNVLQDVGVPRNVAVASVTLSDGVPLGDENAILSRGMITFEAQPPETMSEDLAPSDYIVARRHERVSLVEIDQRASHLVWPLDTDAGMRWSNDGTYSAHAIREPGAVWEGGWDGAWYGPDVVMGMTRIDKPAGDILDDTLLLDVSVIT